MNKKIIIEAVEELAAIPYFPTEPGARAAIMRQLSKFVRDEDSLHWLIDMALAHMKRWMGPAELRSLYATKYRPVDGVEGGACQVAGFTPADSEARYLQSVAQLMITSGKGVN